MSGFSRRDLWIIGAVLAAIVVFGGLAAAGKLEQGDGGGSLSDAYCADLRAGRDAAGVMLGASRPDADPGDLAERAWAMVLESCPEQLRTNDGLRAWLQAWNIDPDA